MVAVRILSMVAALLAWHGTDKRRLAHELDQPQTPSLFGGTVAAKVIVAHAAQTLALPLEIQGVDTFSLALHDTAPLWLHQYRPMPRFGYRFVYTGLSPPSSRV